MDRKRIAAVISVSLAAVIAGVLTFSLATASDPVSVVRGNYEMRALNFTLEKTDDVVCKMLIRSYDGSAQAVEENGETHFFNDVGCLVTWLLQQPRGKKIIPWVYTLDTRRWIDARLAWYGTSDTTVVGYGFGAREKKRPGTVSFDEVKRRVRTHRTLLDPATRKMILENRYR